MNSLSSQKSILKGLVPHVFVWGILFSIPILLSFGETNIDMWEPKRIWNPMLFCAIIFYFNYYFLIDRFLFRDQLLAFILINLLLAGVCLVCSHWMTELLKNINQISIKPPKKNASDYARLRNLFLFLLTCGTSVAIKATQKWQKAEQERKVLEHENLKSELAHLKYQLQPHFFFNSLNNIYSLIGSSPENAKESVLVLAKLMRHVLYDTKEEKILLSHEIEFLKNFIKLMEIRLTPTVKLHYTFPEVTDGLKVPPLLFIPLVENAFKHGISTVQPSFIKIDVRLKDNVLYFDTENTLLSHALSKDPNLSGIGLSNMSKRLDLIYTSKYTFQYGSSNGVFATHLTIEL